MLKALVNRTLNCQHRILLKYLLSSSGLNASPASGLLSSSSLVTKFDMTFSAWKREGKLETRSDVGLEDVYNTEFIRFNQLLCDLVMLYLLALFLHFQLMLFMP